MPARTALLLAASLALPCAAAAQVKPPAQRAPRAPVVTVVRVLDGDTLIAGRAVRVVTPEAGARRPLPDGTCRAGRRIRIWGVQAPELRDAKGPASRAVLLRLAPVGTRLRCAAFYCDRYHRTVALCAPVVQRRAGAGRGSGQRGAGRRWVWPPLDLGAALIAAGAAREWCRYSNRFYGGATCRGK